MKEVKCPCQDCLCVPVCRNKSFFDLIANCKYIKEYESSLSRKITRIEIQKCLKPEKRNWYVSKANDDALIYSRIGNLF